MTGFGDAACQHQGVHYAVELRSVNNRYFKAHVHLPNDLQPLETELEAMLRKQIARGTVTLKLTYSDASAGAAQQVNGAALRQYLAHLEQVEAQAAAQGSSSRHVTIDLAALLAMPGVLQPSTTDAVERGRATVCSLVEQACGRMMAMRHTEGQGVARDIRAHLAVIVGKLAEVGGRAPLVVREYQAKLQARVEELLRSSQVKLQDSELAREVAFFAERCDVSEETQRLGAHVERFEQFLGQQSGEPAGRTLDFLAQEMLREANTIASKSNDTQIAHAVVEIKSAIDRIKEQVQNIE